MVLKFEHPDPWKSRCSRMIRRQSIWKERITVAVGITLFVAGIALTACGIAIAGAPLIVAGVVVAGLAYMEITCKRR